MSSPNSFPITCQKERVFLNTNSAGKLNEKGSCALLENVHKVLFITTEHLRATRSVSQHNIKASFISTGIYRSDDLYRQLNILLGDNYFDAVVVSKISKMAFQSLTESEESQIKTLCKKAGYRKVNSA